MFVFQLQKEKKEDGDKGGVLPADPKEFGVAILSIEKSFREHGLSDFISTLTPGAQNAIYAASFAWGYENASRYLRSAMKTEEVKNAQDSSERSKAVIEGMQRQASSLPSEKSSEVSKSVWSFYNEDMKETQAQAARSEAITEKNPLREEQAPQSASEAVANAVAEQSLNPIVLYCAEPRSIEQQRQLQAEAEKREEMAKLVSPAAVAQEAGQPAAAQKAEEERKALEEKIRADSAQAEIAKSGLQVEVVLSAMQRREEALREIAATERSIRKAIRLLDRMKSDDEARLKKIIGSSLPPSLSEAFLHGKKALFKRAAARKQMQLWLAYCKNAKAAMSAMPLGRIIKLISLSRLFR
jgi:hypothetical protein